MRKLFYGLLFVLIFNIACQTNLSSTLQIPSIIGDNMVLQRNTTVPIWGKESPGTEITVKYDWGGTEKTIVNNGGKWKVQIETPEAGGPHKLTIQSKDKTLSFENVMIGEVWLGSGQSNMEMPVQGWPPNNPIKNSEEVIQNANYSKIRLFNVHRSISLNPAFEILGKWVETTPQTVNGFSATAYFFGRRLYNKLEVPIGLINSSWGGTPAEAWTSKKCLRELADFQNTVQKLNEMGSEYAEFEKWYNQLEITNLSNRPADKRWQGLKLGNTKYSQPSFSTQNWNKMELPVSWTQTEIGTFDGVVWFRKKITIPEEWDNKDLIIELGPIEDMDITYFNGKEIGSHETTGYWQKPRKYEINSEIVKSGQNTIAVCVMDDPGGGGIYGDPEQMKIYPDKSNSDSIPLAGTWKYKPFAEYRNGKLYKFGTKDKSFAARPKLPLELNSKTPSLLYNAMINPIIPYKIKGVIWYQGESNTGQPYQYKKLFPTMIKCWRNSWNRDNLPFYYVQIAPYDYGETTHSELLREAQLETMSLKNTGMIVTTDIFGGNPNIIHPPNKQAVGRRLARWALAKNYDYKNITASGPIYQSYKIKGDKIILSFKYTDSGLMKKGESLQGFEIAGSDSTFKTAKAKIEKNKVIVWHSEIDTPEAVRYGWSNIPDSINLYNKAGLPASPFRTDNWEIGL